MNTTCLETSQQELLNRVVLPPEDVPRELWSNMPDEWKRKNCISRDGIPWWEWPDQSPEWREHNGL